MLLLLLLHHLLDLGLRDVDDLHLLLAAHGAAGGIPPLAGGIPQTPSKWDGKRTFVVVLGYTRQGLGAKAQIWGNRKVGVRHHLQAQ